MLVGAGLLGVGILYGLQDAQVVDYQIMSSVWPAAPIVAGLCCLNGWHAYISLHNDRPNLLQTNAMTFFSKRAELRPVGMDIHLAGVAGYLFLIYAWKVNLYYLLTALAVMVAAKVMCFCVVIGLRQFFKSSALIHHWWVSYYRAAVLEIGVKFGCGI